MTYQITVGTLVAGDAFAGSLTRGAGENMGRLTPSSRGRSPCRTTTT